MPESDRKIYVLDTSTLIHDPDALTSFEEHDIVLPYVVVHELDDLRKAPNGRGLSARIAIRQLEELRDSNPTLTGVRIREGLGRLSVQRSSGQEVAESSLLSKSCRDDMIVNCAKQIAGTSPDRRVVLVAKDIGLRIKSAVSGVETEDYRKSKVESTYTGLHGGIVHLDDPNAGRWLLDGRVGTPDGIFLNEFCYVMCEGYESVGSVLCRNKGGFLRPVPDFQRGVLGIRPMDDNQRMAFDVLTDEDVRCVALIGVAGGGKTLLSLAVGLDGVLTQQHESIMTVKPIIPVGGHDIGYLKGDKFDKLYQWQKSVVDNLRILQMYAGKKNEIPDAQTMFDEGTWQPEAITYMRGRHLHGYWLILDECQNTNEHEMKTALSRVGENTKAVMLADPSQIDNPYVDAESCGAAIVVEKMKGSGLFAAVPIGRSQRSELAQLVADRMG